MSLNKVMIIGRLGQDPEVRYTQSGSAVSNLNVATSENWTDKQGQRQERTEWHRVVVLGKTAENVGKYLKKGRLVFVEGRLQTRSWDDKEGNKRSTTEIVADTVQFLDRGDSPSGESGPREYEPRNQAPRTAPGRSQSGPGPGPEANYDQSFNDDDIPF